MRKFGVIGALLLAGLVAGAVSAAEHSTAPPTDLKKVGDHWTPWDPPPAGPDDYIIQRGDTLWDLAGRWLEDPFLWPQVWDLNRYILDSHWIYPGDPLVIPGRPTVVPPDGPLVGEGDGGEDATGDLEGPTDTATGTTPTALPPRPAPLLPVADAHDVYCTGYIDPTGSRPEIRVAGGASERIARAQGDVIYLNYGNNRGIEAGSEWMIVRRTRSVAHPASGNNLGRYIRRLGKIRVMAVQDTTSMALVEMACEDIRDGDGVRPWADIPVPYMAEIPKLDRLDVEPSGGPTGYVVAVADHVAAVGAGHVIQVDLGESAGTSPGDMLRVYRDNGKMPRIVLAEAVVLTVSPATATARIVSSLRESEVGDRVESLR